MSWYLKALEERLDEGQKLVLDHVHRPQQVALPNGGKQGCLAVCPDGEIRCYCRVDEGRADGYLSSLDGGLSFKEYYWKDGMGPASRNPQSGRYLGVSSTEDGTFCVYSDEGMDDPHFHRVKITGTCYTEMEQPRFMRDGRVYVSLSGRSANGFQTAFAYSDDDGAHWKLQLLSPIAPFRVVAPDKGMRYQRNGTDPTVIEKQDGSLWMLVRSADDFLWQYCSEDGGEHWSSPMPTQIHSTHNPAKLLRLSDGRLMLFWNNTTPLPEENHKNQHGCGEGAILGQEPAVYTNRDACHFAISEDDGAHWIGQRELYLSKYRGQADYRLRGSGEGEKGLYGFDALELPHGKVLVHIGVNAETERLIVVDPAFLYEENQSEDWQDGLYYISTHSFLGGVAGKDTSDSGAYSYNRMPGALLMEDPATSEREDVKREVLHLYRRKDERLLSEKTGATQNFPAWRRGEVTFEMYIAGAPVRISLLDRFINPTDPTVEQKAVFTCDLNRIDTGNHHAWRTFTLAWDLDVGKAVMIRPEMCEDDQLEHCFLHNVIFSIRQNPQEPAPMGISYLHFQTMAEGEDFAGAYIGNINYRKTDEFPYVDLS